MAEILKSENKAPANPVSNCIHAILSSGKD